MIASNDSPTTKGSLRISDTLLRSSILNGVGKLERLMGLLYVAVGARPRGSVSGVPWDTCLVGLTHTGSNSEGIRCIGGLGDDERICRNTL
jgi:hypothetical protein